MKLLFTILALLLTVVATAAEPVQIGTNIQLMWDDSLIESHVNASFKYHRPIPKDVAITTDAPWEGNVSAYFTFLQDLSLIHI